MDRATFFKQFETLTEYQKLLAQVGETREKLRKELEEALDKG